tara:strand:+ start:101675 stop:102454 length:780 start_codon:yes stop_codon:yes gene_type:complete
MEIKFNKYQGTGNDFVMIDCTGEASLEITEEVVQGLCDRRFGIGADGLIAIYEHNSYDFEMRYYNSDGSRSFCGNGARCAVAFANKLGLIDQQARFLAIDGEHEASFDGTDTTLKMGDVQQIEIRGEEYIINTGSPHYISFVDELSTMDIVDFGKKIRYSDEFTNDGINVNLAETVERSSLSVLTYERGVEDETFSCGTGVTAVALAYAVKEELELDFEVKIKVKGGNLKVRGRRKDEGFESIYLIGPATFVYEGTISI